MYFLRNDWFNSAPQKQTLLIPFLIDVKSYQAELVGS